MHTAGGGSSTGKRGERLSYDQRTKSKPDRTQRTRRRRGKVKPEVWTEREREKTGKLPRQTGGKQKGGDRNLASSHRHPPKRINASRKEK